jgi:GDP-mannose 6-dehydrogenase
MKKVAVFGMGYVGCVTACCLSQDGHSVIGVDVDPAKVAEINAGHSPVTEPGLEDLIGAQTRSGRLQATIDADQAVRQTEMALIAVGTPSADDGSVDYVAVERVLHAIGSALRAAPRPYWIVVRSTLLPGILEERLSLLLENAAGRQAWSQLHLCNNPEFLREGTAIRDYYQPPFVLVGAADEQSAGPILDLYGAVKAETRITDTRTAALVKYTCNCYHALKVSFANEIGSLARSFHADGHAVMDLVCSDQKLNISRAYLRPGFAFGGSCLPKDLRALTRHAEKQALRLNLLAAVIPSNEQHVKRALKLIRDMGHKKVGLIGLSFKAGTDDLRESPFVELAETLVGWGYDVKIYDPNVNMSRLRGRNLAYVDQHLPHLAQLLAPLETILSAHNSLLILGNDVADGIGWQDKFQGAVLDLRRDLSRPHSPSPRPSPARGEGERGASE